MRKSSRRIVIALIFFLIATVILLFTIEKPFLKCIGKGFFAAIIIIPLMNNHYGDTRRYKFEL